VATDPLKVYWIMYTQAPHVHEEGLTVVERHTAYGYMVVPNPIRGVGWHTVTLTAVPTKPIHIARERDHARGRGPRRDNEGAAQSVRGDRHELGPTPCEEHPPYVLETVVHRRRHRGTLFDLV